MAKTINNEITAMDFETAFRSLEENAASSWRDTAPTCWKRQNSKSASFPKTRNPNPKDRLCP